MKLDFFGIDGLKGIYMIKKCLNCNKKYKIISKVHRFCSERCRTNYKSRQYYHKHISKERIRGHNKNLTGSGIYTALKNINTNPKFHIRIDGSTPKLLISLNEFKLWYNNQEKICHYCKRTIEELHKHEKRFLNVNRMTIDRADNAKNYTLSNIRLACPTCNSLKSSLFTEQEMLKIGKIIQLKFQNKQEIIKNNNIILHPYNCRSR
jgi:5-methylcytosine-specific restriction endonuclease McrA